MNPSLNHETYREQTFLKPLIVSQGQVAFDHACGGKLHLSQSSYNGHVHGKCETPDCVSWME